MVRALVILPTTGYRTSAFVDAASSLGVDLAIASEQPDPLSADDRFVLIDCQRPDWSAERIVDLADRTPIDAIIAADDSGVEIAALASERLALPNHPPVSARATRDKAAMRRRLADLEVPQPVFETPIPTGVASAAARLGWPVVIKPRTLTASRGVLRVDRPDQIPVTVERIQRIRGEAGEDVESELVVERFVPGREVTVEGIVSDGYLEVLAVMEKPDPLDGPAFQEVMFVTPPRISSQQVADLVDTVRRGVIALGLRHGPIHAEARLSPDGPMILEIAARTIGGLCGQALQFGLLGSSLETLVLRNALGLRRRIPSPTGASGVAMIPIPTAGILRGVGGVENAMTVDHVTDIRITAVVGQPIAPPPEGDHYLGFVFARAGDPDLVEQALREALTKIEVNINPNE